MTTVRSAGLLPKPTLGRWRLRGFALSWAAWVWVAGTMGAGCGSTSGGSAEEGAGDGGADGAIDPAGDGGPSGDGASGSDAASPDGCGPEVTDWELDAVGVSGSDPSIAVDAEGALHLVFLNNEGLRYATNASGTWTTELASAVSGITRITSVAVDTTGGVHAVLGQITGSNVLYATNASGAWTSERIDSGGLGGSVPRIGMHPDGDPVIIYRGGPHDTLDHLRVARPGAEGWEIDRARVYAEMPDMAFSPDGTLHLVTSGTATRPNLRYWNDATGELVAETVAQGRPGAMARTADGTLHVVYTLRSDTGPFVAGALMHASRAPGGAAWAYEAILASGGWARGERRLEMTADAAGALHVFYDLSDDPCGVYHATNESGAWQTSVFRGRSGSFDVTSEGGAIRVVFSGSLTVARRAP
jgi:hypothetical protein